VAGDQWPAQIAKRIPAVYANVDSVLTAWTARTEPSREAAQEFSPRRQPWVGEQEPTSPEGATETKSSRNSVSMSGRLAWGKTYAAGCWQMYKAESFAPLGLSLPRSRPTAYAVGCILAPLRGFPIFL